MTTKTAFLTGWDFQKTSLDATLQEVMAMISNWQPVDVPHDWLIGQVHNLYEDSMGWYRNKIEYLPAVSEQVAIYFEGVYMDCTLYVNGIEAGSWKYGYSSFSFDLTAFLIEGQNDIYLRVCHQAPNSRWYSGAGIYRPVWLMQYSDPAFVIDGTYITPKALSDNRWELHVSCEVTQAVGNISFFHELLDMSGHVIHTFSGNTTLINAPTLWDIDTPYLYTLHSSLLQDGQVVDECNTSFGFRTISFTANEGFFLNDKHIKLHGVCLHHDLGALGAAFHISAAKRQLEILRAMGVNAIRFAHNMPAPDMLKLTDEMGFLVMDESFDMWERSKTTYDYARFFKDWYQKDIASWIRRDRNHPSIIMWSIGNEIYDTHADADAGKRIIENLIAEVNRHDPDHHAAITLCSNYMPWENTQKCADLVKLIGYNYGEKLYDKHHEAHPDWIIYGSETSSIVSSRGVYHFPLSVPLLSDDDEQCSALGNSTTSWGAKSLEACFYQDESRPYSLGQFLWSGFDYIGEPTPYHTKNSYFGMVDTAGFPKDSYYFFQSVWTDYRITPMVHLLPYWDFNEGQCIDVRIFSNAPFVELFLNGQSLGITELHRDQIDKITANYRVVYKSGTLKAQAYDENMLPIATDIQHSFGDASEIVLSCNTKQTCETGENLAFVTISMKDCNGNPVCNANNRVTVSVEGAGCLLGLDNGDSTDPDEYQTNSKRLFNGKLLAIVSGISSPNRAETIVNGVSNLNNMEALLSIRVSSQGLADAMLELSCFAGSISQPSSVSGNNIIRTNAALLEIPLRKISLIASQGQKFHPGLTEMTIQAKLYPENASFHDLIWRVTSNTGADIKNATITPLSEDNTLIKLTAHGDGDFMLRCSSLNGRNHVNIMSMLDFQVAGLGSLLTNPYDFVSGSLYSSFTGELTPGNERGVATSRDLHTTVSFDCLDFGSYGSDQITMPIFELESKPTEITFWEGVGPLTAENCLGTFVYDKKSIWNVYQEETFTLTRRLKGVTAFSLGVTHKIHIKGFSFAYLEKAFATLRANEADQIYGDTYTIEQEVVSHIGNNVSFVFQDMDFGSNGCHKITICGNCPIDKNSIHIHFKPTTCNSSASSIHTRQDIDFADSTADNIVSLDDFTQLVEFQHTDCFAEQCFTLPAIYGAYTVTLLFLPGSQFDMKWIRFA